MVVFLLGFEIYRGLGIESPVCGDISHKTPFLVNPDKSGRGEVHSAQVDISPLSTKPSFYPISLANR